MVAMSITMILIQYFYVENINKSSMCRVIGYAKAEKKSITKVFLRGWLPDAVTNPSKREFELFALQYTAIWIAAFAVVAPSYFITRGRDRAERFVLICSQVIVLQLYEQFTANSYMALCTTLAAPFLLQPIVYPLPSERSQPLFQRYTISYAQYIN
jgi:hypothetical protein